jgi:predicted nucleic acid-binding protein
MIFVDAGFLLAIAQPKDALHQRSRDWASILAEPLLVTEYVLWETVNCRNHQTGQGRCTS